MCRPAAVLHTAGAAPATVLLAGWHSGDPPHIKGAQVSRGWALRMRLAEAPPRGTGPGLDTDQWQHMQVVEEGSWTAPEGFPRVEEAALSRVANYCTTNRELVRAADAGTLPQTVSAMAAEHRRLDHVNVATALQRLARRRSAVDPSVVRYFARELRLAVTPFGPTSVGSTLYGLLGGTSAEHRALFSAMVPHVRACRHPLDSGAVGGALSGLVRQTEEVEEFNELLWALVPLVAACPEELHNRDIGAMMGLQRCTATPPVRGLVAALTGLLRRRGNRSPSDQAVAGALYGLGMHQDTPELREFLSEITKLTRRVAMAPRTRNVSCALLGLARRWPTPGTRELLAALAGYVRRATEPLDAQGVANSLCGFGLLRHSPEGERVLWALLPLVRGCSERLTLQGAALALHGLRYVRGDVCSQLLREVARLLPREVPRLPQGARYAVSALFTLRVYNCSPATRAVLCGLAPLLPTALAGPLTTDQLADARRFIDVAQKWDHAATLPVLRALVPVVARDAADPSPELLPEEGGVDTAKILGELVPFARSPQQVRDSAPSVKTWIPGAPPPEEVRALLPHIDYDNVPARLRMLLMWMLRKRLLLDAD